MISRPYAPAFMRSAPPTVPGMPLRNSRPETPAPRPSRATDTSIAAAPARIRVPPHRIAAKGRPRRIVTPGIPPSRTSRFEPTPITVTAMSAGSARRNSARSSRSAGSNRISAGPPTRNHSSRASGTFSRSEPRTAGRRSSVRAGAAASTMARPRVCRGRDRALVGKDGRQLPGQRVGPGGDVAGTETDDHVARKRRDRQSAAQARQAIRASARRGDRVSGARPRARPGLFPSIGSSPAG